jgi:hypothetical protein
MKQLKASMPDELAERLEKACAISGRSLSAEICARVEASFAHEAVDKPTRDFLGSVAAMAVEIERETSAVWHQHAGAHGALKQAILSRLHLLKPRGATTFGDRPHATFDNHDPRQVGQIIESRLQEEPNFTNSPTRRFLEEEHKRSRVTILTIPLAPDEQQELDQPKKRGK